MLLARSVWACCLGSPNQSGCRLSAGMPGTDSRRDGLFASAGEGEGLVELIVECDLALRIREFCLSADPWASRRKGRGGAVVLIKWAGDGVEALGDQLLNRLGPQALFSISMPLGRPLELTIVGGLLFSQLQTPLHDPDHLPLPRAPPAVDVASVADPLAPACRRGAPTHASLMSVYCARKSAIP